MPHDLFGDVLVRPRSVSTRRSSVAVISVIAHGAAVAAILIAPLIATDVLPPPSQRAIAFLADSVLPKVPVISLGHSQKTLPSSSEPSGHEVAPAPAPLEVNSGIKPESGLEPGTGGAGSGAPPVVGLIEGLGATGRGGELPPPPPTPAAPKPVHVGIHGPQKLVDVPPTYPPAARAARIEGIVVIEATIDTGGNVVAARTLKSVPLLEQAALDAVRRWKFTPTLLNGVPVPVIMTVTVTFTLK